MTPEDHLDQLIEQHLHQDSSLLPASEEEAAQLAAAAALARLNVLEAPPERAAQLKARFRAELRARQNGHITLPERPPAPLAARRRLRFPIFS